MIAYPIAGQCVVSQADSLLALKPVSVMLKSRTAVSGDKHDYLSQARYCWPDSTRPNGLPYIHRDGVTNPEIYTLDRPVLSTMANRVATLALAWALTRDERYAQKAVDQLDTWFVDPSTRMNPSLEYAQVVPGENRDRGRCYGVLDGYSFVDVINAAEQIADSKAFATVKDGLIDWFTQFKNWLVESEQGKEESKVTNNHSIVYDVELATMAAFVGDTVTAHNVIRQFVPQRLVPQVLSDGSQPHELARTLSFHYSVYNLAHMIDMAELARDLGEALDMTLIEAAADFLIPYLGHPESWPYQQISGWDKAQHELIKQIGRLAWLTGQERYLSLLDPVEAAFAHAGYQLSCLAKNAESQGEGFPRSVNDDGTIKLVNAHDWCSGFFPGSLWHLYEYTRSPYWLSLARKWSTPVEEIKSKTDSHDLGFMVGDSFGRGYSLTADTLYRDVVVEASRSLATRYNPNVGCIRSWDFNRDRWSYPVIIDNMMNLEMLFEATRITGDSTFHNIAVTHALTTLDNHFRDDASCYHVVDYDEATGEVRWRGTFQGAHDESVWSRGQAWAVYGYTMCYRYTGDQRFLDHAVKVAEYLRSLPNIPSDGIFYWDMAADANDSLAVGCPAGHGREGITPRDASAAAIVASALYELAGFVPQSEIYSQWADNILDTLYREYRCKNGHGFVLDHSTGFLPAGSEIDVPLNYADYYYLEALLRKSKQR
ncbi:MAG: alginate lyase family protein [Bacteroidales bacterium]|nr:alginate lyase family protein [Bacteroidales bacterium]